MRSLSAGRGIISACVWDYAGKMELLRYFRDAAVAKDSNARDLDEGKRFPICRPGTLADLFRASRLCEVCCESIEITTEFASFDDYWDPLLGGTGPAPSYVASLDPDRLLEPVTVIAVMSIPCLLKGLREQGMSAAVPGMRLQATAGRAANSAESRIMHFGMLVRFGAGRPCQMLQFFDQGLIYR
ncbi:MAG: hypothetical protein WBQ78_02840 [Gammaproteobacteria bacterium]